MCMSRVLIDPQRICTYSAITLSRDTLMGRFHCNQSRPTTWRRARSICNSACHTQQPHVLQQQEEANKFTSIKLPLQDKALWKPDAYGCTGDAVDVLLWRIQLFSIRPRHQGLQGVTLVRRLATLYFCRCLQSAHCLAFTKECTRMGASATLRQGR